MIQITEGNLYNTHIVYHITRILLFEFLALQQGIFWPNFSHIVGWMLRLGFHGINFVCMKFTTIPWTMFRLYNGSHEMSLAQECHAKLLEFFLWIFWPTFNHIFCDHIAFFPQSVPSPGAHGFHDHWPHLPGFYLCGSKRMYHSSFYKNTRRLEPFQSHEVFKI